MRRVRSARLMCQTNGKKQKGAIRNKKGASFLSPSRWMSVSGCLFASKLLMWVRHVKSWGASAKVGPFFGVRSKFRGKTLWEKWNALSLSQKPTFYSQLGLLYTQSAISRSGREQALYQLDRYCDTSNWKFHQYWIVEDHTRSVDRNNNGQSKDVWNLLSEKIWHRYLDT